MERKHTDLQRINKQSIDETVRLKIAILGKSLVGKSALTYRFIKDKFPTNHDTTIEDQYKVNMNIEGIDCCLGEEICFIILDILDTAGQDDYQSMLDTWVGSADGFVLVYAIDNKNSFDGIKSRYDRIVKNKGKDKFNVILIGNKCDLKDKRQVQKEELEKLAIDCGNAPHLEASALEKINVHECFISLARNMLGQKGVLKKDASKAKKRCLCF